MIGGIISPATTPPTVRVIPLGVPLPDQEGGISVTAIDYQAISPDRATAGTGFSLGISPAPV